jgi:hypothetical protein
MGILKRAENRENRRVGCRGLDDSRTKERMRESALTIVVVRETKENNPDIDVSNIRSEFYNFNQNVSNCLQQYKCSTS